MAWWYLSFRDPTRPKGTQFIGAAIVDAWSSVLAVETSHSFGCNPGGAITIALVPSRFGEPPAASAHRLLVDRSEIEQIFRTWSGDPNDRLQTLDALKAEGASVSHVLGVRAADNRMGN